MRLALILLWSVEVLAGAPPDLGTFSGALFTGPSVIQTIHVSGGTLSNCKEDSGTLSDIYSCSLNSAVISVTSDNAKSPDAYTFDSAKVLISKDRARRHYYYRGTRTLQVGGKVFTQAINATINIDALVSPRISGYLELSESKIRSWFEAFYP